MNESEPDGPGGLFAEPRKLFKKYFAQRYVYPWELPSIMRRHIYTGAMGNVYFSLIAGILFVYFGNRIGISKPLWGLMGGIASFLLASQLWSAVLTQRLGKRKLLWFITGLAGRVIRVVSIIASLWLWHIGFPHVAAFLIVMICVSNFVDAMAGPPWLSWLADIIPAKEHGLFWGRRAAWVSLAVICVALPAAWLVDRAPEDWKMQMVVVVLTVAGIVGILDILIHGTIPEPVMITGQPNHFMTDIMTPMRDPDFRPWLVFTVAWQFSMTLGGALATLYFVDDLRLKDNFLGATVALTVFGLAGALITGRWSGRLVDRVGVRPVLWWGHLFWAMLPLTWIVATPRTGLFWVGLSALVGGFASTAATTASSKLVTRFAPSERCAMYVAVSACLASFAGGLGALTAGGILGLLENWHGSVGSWTFGGFHVVFAGSLVLRLFSATVLLYSIKTLGEGNNVCVIRPLPVKE